VEIEEIVVDLRALERLAEYSRSRRWRHALLVMDANTEEAAGSRAARELAAAGVEPHVLRFPQRSGLLAGEEPLAAARARFRAERPDGVAAVGSGVLTDITRYACHLEGRDFVSVPTAASMDGYASSVAAMELGGVKVSYPAVAPRAISANPSVLAAAPAEMTRSGLGDLLAKASARTDWIAAHLLYGEPFCAEADARVLEPLEHAAAQAEALLAGERQSIERLLIGLLQSGIAIAMVGSSRPASGCEHHASHFWDLLAARGLRPHRPHGLQVGYATHFAMRLQRFAYGGGVPVLGRPGGIRARDEDATAWLGEPGEALREVMVAKRRFLAEQAAHWPEGDERWGQIRAQLAESALAIFPRVEHALTLAGIPAEAGFLALDAATLRATFRQANRLRARYTVLDFLEGQAVLEQALGAVLPGGPEAAG
jgi:glycerol-1-phosphate dehydrogenase [NAD(P)+]